MVRLRRYVFSSLVLIGLLLVAGCDTNKSTLAPARTATSASTQATRYVVDDTGTIYFVRVTIGTVSILCVCDYPSGFMGPMPDGHCQAPAPDYPRDYVAGRLEVGKTYQRAKNAADNDGILLR